jgi:hypothetical protein
MLIGTKKDLEKLTCSPMEFEKYLSKPLRLKSTLASLGRISKVSSAYCTMGKSPTNEPLNGCLITPKSQALLTIDCNRSAAKTNKSGERGSPCLTPLLQLKGLPGFPLRRIEDVPDFNRLWIQLTHFAEKHLCSMT